MCLLEFKDMYMSILHIMFSDIQSVFFCYFRSINRRIHVIFPFVQYCKYCIIYVIVNQYDSIVGTSNKVRYKRICIKISKAR